jgi:alkylated DNA repair protein (DNA oxidative demethylase)
MPTRTEIAPGAVHVSGWLTLEQQRDLVGACREWARPPAPMRHTRLPNGGVMSVQTVCLGWHWLPYRYSRTADDVDGALINYYADGAKLGMHQDKDERSDEPVVSLSIGDDCVFRFGNRENRGRPYTDVELRSGDLFVFGGPSRFAYHGVPKTRPGTADPATGLTTGRLNLTLRVTGLAP